MRSEPSVEGPLLLPAQKLAETLDALNVGMCLFDQDDRTLLWNDTFLRLFPEHAGKVYRGEPYRDNLRRFYHVRLDPNELQHIERYIEDGVKRHRQQSAPFEFNHRDRRIRVASAPMQGVGRVRLWTSSASLLVDAEVVAQGMAKGDKLHSMSEIDDIADGLMVRDPDGAIRFVNRSLRQIYGLQGDHDAIGHNFRNFYRARWEGEPRQSEILATLTDNDLFAGAPFVVELPDDRWVRVIEHRALDGSCISTHADITALHRLQRETDEAKAKAEAMAAALQALIDERDRAEAALRQAQRIEAVGLLTSGLAHDFNNLLTVMLANLERLEPAEGDAERRNYLAVIRSAVERGAALTGQLLSFARLQPLAPKPVDLAKMAGDMAPLLRSVCDGSVVVQIEVPAGLPYALVDPAQLELVVLNLALNAREALPQGGHIWVEGRVETLAANDDPEAPEPGQYVVFSVRDDGVGMTEEVRQRAVEPFFTTKQPGQGSGLGLSQAYGLARQSGGTVRISSEIGKGTAVDIVLPAVSAVQQSAHPVCAPANEAKRLRVLLVDDDLLLLKTISELLSLQGIDVDIAPTGIAAQRMIEAGAVFDVLVTDVRMPMLTGAELAHWMWARDPSMPVVLSSGYAAPDDIANLNGPWRLLRKPFLSSDMCAVIKEMAAARR